MSVILNCVSSEMVFSISLFSATCFFLSKTRQSSARFMARRMTSKSKQQIAIISATDSPKWQNIIEVYTNSLRLPSEYEFVLFNAYENQLPDPNQFCGIIVSGSHYNVRDSLPWFQPLIAFIQEVHARKSPKLMATCFGHQLVAHALGGKVDYNPDGCFELGVQSMYKTESNAHYMDHIPNQFKIMQSHGDSVIDLPPDATLLVTSTKCVNEMYSIGEHILSYQFHPELSNDEVLEKIFPYMEKKFSKEEYKAVKENLMTERADEEVVNLALASFLIGS